LKMEEIVRFLYEAGQLKNVPRSGWLTIRAPNESVAEHSHRTAIVAYILAKMAKLSLQEENAIIKAALIHDLHEARIGDLHIISKRYTELDEKGCEKEQLENLPEEIKDDLQYCMNLPPKLQTYLKDADKLECAIQAKEYLDLGYKSQDWIDNTEKMLKTKEAKLLFEKLIKENSLEWLSEQRKK